MKRIHKFLKSKKPIKWLFYGDSITHGAFHTLGWRDYTELFSERVRCELYRDGDIVLKTAYNGNTTRHLLESFDWRVGQFQPHVVFLMIGMNDCVMEKNGTRVPVDEFRGNLQILIKRIRALGSIPVLQTTCLILSGEAPERASTLPPYMDVVRSVAIKTKILLIDHTAHWQKLCKDQSYRYHYWLSDALHPNELGHRVFANLIFEKLGIFDATSPVCRLFYP